MLEWLIANGRACVSAGAVAVVAVSTMFGWYLVWAIDKEPSNVLTMPRLLGAGTGLVAGSLLAGLVFGIAAAIFDIQKNVRILAKSGPGAAAPKDDGPVAYRHRDREPTL
jgi:hypothetical protein